jgi:hypothetical protein
MAEIWIPISPPPSVLVHLHLGHVSKKYLFNYLDNILIWLLLNFYFTTTISEKFVVGNNAEAETPDNNFVTHPPCPSVEKLLGN